MKVRDILERASSRYNDKDYIRVPFTGYLEFLDDSINQLIMSRPDSHVKTEVVGLRGGTRQSLPEDGYSLINISRNMEPAGNDPETNDPLYTPAGPILQVDRDDLDYFSNWHEGEGVTYVREFAYSLKTPKTFWVSAPIKTPVPADPTSYTHIELDYSYGIPSFAERYTGENNEILDMDIPLDRVFMGAIVNYMLYLLYSVDDGSTIGPTMAQRYEKSFYQALGIEYQASVLVEPKVGRVPEQVTATATGV